MNYYQSPARKWGIYAMMLSISLYVCPSVRVSPEMRKNAVFSKIKQFRAMVSIDDQ